MNPDPLAPPPDSIDRCNCLAARQAARFLTALYDRALQSQDLRTTQFSILHELTKNSPVSIGELAHTIAMDRTTLSTNLKPLERDGLVTIVTGEDRRSKKASISTAGLARYRKAQPLWAAVQLQFEQAYGGAKPAAKLREAQRAVLRTGFEPWAETA